MITKLLGQDGSLNRVQPVRLSLRRLRCPQLNLGTSEPDEAGTLRGGKTMHVKRALLVLLLALFVAIPLPLKGQADGEPYDILITGGRIVDGTGNPWF